MDNLSQHQLAEFTQYGRLWLRGALAEHDLGALDLAAQSDDLPGKRLCNNSCFDNASPLARLIAAVFPNQRPVRALSFNKSKAVNWGVPWHQDRVIAVRARHDIAGYSNWSLKGEQWHCEPPAAVLGGMLFVRFHLDPADEQSGPMEIAMGSHAAGLVASSLAAKAASDYPSESCLARRGDVLVLHMLTIHRSKPAENPTSRRTLRVDFSAEPLPLPLCWAD